MFREIVPALRMLPLYVSRPLGFAGIGGQFIVMAMLGIVMIGHVAETVLAIATPVFALTPVAVNVSVMAQAPFATG